MYTVKVSNEKGEEIEKNTRDFQRASEAVAYVQKLLEWYRIPEPSK
jgi:hypothetical protein